MTRKHSKKVVGGLTKGDLTRQAAVTQALQIAAREGLGAISIGRLATELRMSKSGLFLHFGSKENLESAVVAEARVQFLSHVVKPVDEAKLKGIERVWGLCESWLDFVERGPFPGAYFFSGAFFQTAKQNGLVPRHIRRVVRDWIDALTDALRQAKGLDELQLDLDLEEVAFELNCFLLGAQWSRLMTGRDYTNARSAILSKLHHLAAEQIPDRAFRSVKAWKSYLGNRHEL